MESVEENDIEATQMDDAWAEALKEQRDAETGSVPIMEEEQQAGSPEAGSPEPTPQGKPRISDALASAAETATVGLDLLLSIPIEVSVRLGETKLVINDLMQLGQGSIIELDKLAGSDLDLMINDVIMGRGEVVVVNDRFGLRVTEIMSPEERIKGLG